MKKYLFMLLLILAVSPASAGVFTSKSILQLPNQAVPAKPGGSAHSEDSVRVIIEGTARQIGWEPVLQEDGLLHASITVRGRHYARIGISYSHTNFSIFYIDSRGLDYNAKRKKIHKAYNNWVTNLSESVKRDLRSNRSFAKPTSSASSIVRVPSPSPASEADAVSHYFSGRELDLIEGIWTWDDNNYQVAVTKNDTGLETDYDFIGVVIRAEPRGWKAGDVKLLFNSTATPTIFTGVYFDGNHSRNNLSHILENTNLIKVNRTFGGGQPLLLRDYPGGRTQDIPDSGLVAATGTCFVVSPRGVAVTSHHVIEGASKVIVALADGREVPATVESTSAATDLAVLNLNTSTPNYLSLASTRSTQVGEQVFTVGFPTVDILGSEAKFTEGSISALSGIRGEASYMQISVPVQPGNSGGPVVNYNGEVLGVVAATAAVEAFYKNTGSLPQNVNWAVKSDFIQPMLPDSPGRAKSPDRTSAISRAQKAVCKVSVAY